MWGWELLQATEYIGWTGTSMSPKDYSRVSVDNRGWAVAAQLRQEAKELQMGWKLGHWLTGEGGGGGIARTSCINTHKMT